MADTKQKILVLKHGALGDVVQGLDAFACLRDQYPNAHISLLTSAAFQGFFASCPWFDTVIVDPRAAAWRLDQYFPMRALFRQGWDMVLDLQCSSRTRRYHQLFFRTNAGRWFGDAAGCSDPIPDFTGVNNRDRMLITVGLAGVKQGKAGASLDWLLAGARIVLPPTPYCVLIPGCSAAKPSKRWSAERFIHLAKQALAQGIRPVLIGTSVDRLAVLAVHEAVPEALNLLGQTSLADLVALAGSSRFIVGGDTGPVFLAALAGRPTIMVMGSDTDPAMSAPVGKGACYLRADNVADISAVSVFERFQTLE